MYIYDAITGDFELGLSYLDRFYCQQDSIENIYPSKSASLCCPAVLDSMALRFIVHLTRMSKSANMYMCSNDGTQHGNNGVG